MMLHALGNRVEDIFGNVQHLVFINVDFVIVILLLEAFIAIPSVFAVFLELLLAAIPLHHYAVRGHLVSLFFGVRVAASVLKTA